MENFLGRKLKEALSARRMKQVELCRAAGVSPSRLSNYVSGAREPDIETLSKLAHILGKPLDYFSIFSRETNSKEDMDKYLNFISEKDTVSVEIITEFGIRTVRIPGKVLAKAIAC